MRPHPAYRPRDKRLEYWLRFPAKSISLATSGRGRGDAQFHTSIEFRDYQSVSGGKRIQNPVNLRPDLQHFLLLEAPPMHGNSSRADLEMLPEPLFIKEIFRPGERIEVFICDFGRRISAIGVKALQSIGAPCSGAGSRPSNEGIRNAEPPVQDNHPGATSSNDLIQKRWHRGVWHRLRPVGFERRDRPVVVDQENAAGCGLNKLGKIAACRGRKWHDSRQPPIIAGVPSGNSQ